MGVWFLAYNVAICCWMKICVPVHNLRFGHLEVMWQNWTKYDCTRTLSKSRSQVLSTYLEN